jgi:hypothetical protein
LTYGAQLARLSVFERRERLLGDRASDLDAAGFCSADDAFPLAAVDRDALGFFELDGSSAARSRSTRYGAGMISR